ncbi:hypothetical protein CRM22_005043 [Opisthorchis felineus]|uniref:Uncharacterized protein n=1 Tax=Opisthorchis felineus TaxID=147828 RepID=A0A4S2M002_OPIFE|nr:hypothetical protein CRM22_005043 [Opisthorchis felineus]TGZ66968.1 hypothetical protein CRM22_005043 [Opisthorchis felineus]TGZ66969.1 hypothetical protein CRM22_005043 [Opisthorchis felineus]
MRIELLSQTERGAAPLNPHTASGTNKTAPTVVSIEQCKQADGKAESETPVPLFPTSFSSDTTTVVINCATTSPCSPVWSGVRIGRPPKWRTKVLSTYIPDRTELHLRKISPRYVTMTHWEYDPTKNSTTSQEAMSLTQIVTSDPSISIFDKDPLTNGDTSSEDLSSTKEDSLDFEHPEFLEFSTNDPGIFGGILFPVDPLSPVSKQQLEHTPVSDHEDQLEKDETDKLAKNRDSCASGNKEPRKSILRPAKPVIIPQNATGSTYFSGGSEIYDSSRTGLDPRKLIPQYDFRNLNYQDQYLGKLGSIKLTVRYCFSCRSIRLHLSGICSKCNRPHSVTNTGFLLPRAVKRYASSTYLLSDMTELLSSAATGLSEFAQPSSSDDDQVELSGHTNNLLDFPSNKLRQPSHEPAENETTDKAYATEYSNAALNHLAKPHQADDIFLSSSTSGSMGSETDKRLGNSTYTRPKLPWALTNQQSSGSPRGKILPFHQQQNTTVPYQHLQNYDGLPVTQNLISELERRTVLNKKQKDTDDHRERLLSNSPGGATEDQEVANVMLGSAHTAGLNQRLLAMLQRRKNLQNLFEVDQKLDTHNLLRTQPRRSAVTPSSARTQSQQPTSRLSEGLNTERRRDSSLLTLRTTSQNRNSSFRREPKFPEKQAVQASRAKARTNSSQPHRLGDTPRSTSVNTKVTFGNPPSMCGSSDGSKLSAIQTWQRRKTYDPHVSSQPKTSKEGIRSTNQSGRVGKSQDRTSERLTSSAYQSTKNGQRTNRRLMNGLNRTAPVETADCLEALATIEAHSKFPAHCSVVPKILLQNQSQNSSEMVAATHPTVSQSKTRSETVPKPTVTNAPSSVDGRKRQARSASSHSQYPSSASQQKRNEPNICLTNGSRNNDDANANSASFSPLGA